jgi:hypothetical protein
LGCVYIPPENSLYSSIDAFLDTENELVNYIEKASRFLLKYFSIFCNIAKTIWDI